jgi:hypothetical protein
MEFRELGSNGITRNSMQFRVDSFSGIPSNSGNFWNSISFVWVCDAKRWSSSRNFVELIRNVQHRGIGCLIHSYIKRCRILHSFRLFINKYFKARNDEEISMKSRTCSKCTRIRSIAYTQNNTKVVQVFALFDLLSTQGFTLIMQLDKLSETKVVFP